MSLKGESILGIGIDLEETNALARFDARARQEFLSRWLTPEERVWCLEQPDLGVALVIAISCKEAVYKALGRETPRSGTSASLPGERDLVRTTRVGGGPGRGIEISVVWTLLGGRALAVAWVRAANSVSCSSG